ncbi:hypothetical protein L873DRAFT_1672156, partial [Choiromyces venosus 120613-1]
SNEKLGLRWLKEVFDSGIKEREQGNHHLLLIDGYTSHFNWEFFNFCLNNKILPLCLPTHSTHLLQLLDVGLFGPLQGHSSNGLDVFVQKGHTGLNKGKFLSLVLFFSSP